MSILDGLFFIVGWNVIGAIFQSAIATGYDIEGYELVNPYWSYYYCESLNWFGAIMVSLGYSLLSPIITIGYWFYKLCTIGRK